MPRIYLSSPHIGPDEQSLVADAFATNWVAPLGPHVDAFERELAGYVGVGHAAALSSGTAAIHLGLRLLGVQPGDDVFCSTLTFSASANPIAYERARPVFIDAERGTWNMDPGLLAGALEDAAEKGKLPRAVIVVDLYGQSADWAPIEETCAKYGVPILEDAAEALGADYRGRKCGTFGALAVFSFNGNKIITTSGGGMLVSNDKAIVDKARFLATQARDPAPHYQHSDIGFNYRMSNICAAIGRGQLRVLEQRISARRRVHSRYHAALAQVPGIAFMPQAHGRATRWLTCIVVDESVFGASRESIRLALAEKDIEARPVWKPMHLQPVFQQMGAGVVGGAVSEDLFEHGLCLPSGSNLSDADVDEVIEIVLGCARRVPSPARGIA
jgi:dTDP-4-amino-4,6-dideoxygalactose transaminase